MAKTNSNSGRVLLLLSCLYRSSSDLNIIKHEKDKKKRGKAVGNIIGKSILYILLIAYCIAMSVGYGEYGLAPAIPVIAAATISLLAFVFTLLKTNGYLFAFKDYDMLISLPFSIKEVVSAKFLYMYIQTFPWFASISLSMLIGYGVYEHPAFYSYIIWLVLSLVLPLIPMIAAAAVGSLIAAIGAGFKRKSIVQTVLTLVFILAIFALRFILEKLIREDALEETFNVISDSLDSLKQGYLPIKWFQNAVTDTGISDILLLIGLSILIYEAFFLIVSKYYRSINSKLMSSAAGKAYKVKEMKAKSPVRAIVFNEFKRFLASTNYFINMGLGQIFTIIISIAVLFVDIDKILNSMLQGAPVTKEMLYPAIPLIIYFLLGMTTTTTTSLSLEGHSYWIVQSLPITKKDLLKGKIIFQLLLTLPFMLVGSITLGISFGTGIVYILLFIVCGTMLCLFSTAWGMVCGIKHCRFDWTNDIEVIKQGSAVAIYMFPNMFVTMGLVVAAVALGIHVNGYLVVIATALLALILAALCFLRIRKLSASNKYF